MTSIPQEILDIIIGYATTSSTADQTRYFSSVSLVSHIFHQIVLPYKFRSLTLTFRINLNNNYRLDIIPKFCEAINVGDAHALSLAPLVQELDLLRWRFSKLENRFERFEKIINGVLSFRNLTKLSMEGCYISPAIMERLGKLVQLQSLRAWTCRDEKDDDEYHMVSYGALSNLQSLHTLECIHNYFNAQRQLACIPMKNLRILKSYDWEVTKAFLTTDPPVQLEELELHHDFRVEDYLLLWNYLARVTSLTHLSLPNIEFQLPHPSFVFPLQELQYLCVHVVSAPLFADLPMKEMEISSHSFFEMRMTYTTRRPPIISLVRQHWQGVVFPHVEHLKTDQSYYDSTPFKFWREFLPNLQKVQ